MTNQVNVATERSVKEFTFKSLTKICLSNGIKTSSPERSHILAVSTTHGLLFIACENGFVIIQLRDVYDIDSRHTQNKHLARITDCPIYATANTVTSPSYLGLSCNNELLAVVHQVSGCPHADVYSVANLINTAVPAAPCFTMRLSTTSGVTLTDAKWNPAVPGLLATCMSDGNATLWGVTLDNFTVQKTFRQNTGVTALCWSPKGKQIVVGFSDGSLIQMDQTMSAVKKKWPAPSSSVFDGRPCRVLDVLWESTYTFVVAYLPQQPNEREQPQIVIVTVPPKEGTPSLTNFEDMCYSSGTSSLPKCFLTYIPAWGVCCVGLSNSLEIAVLARNAESKTWERWNLDDSGRAELPMNENNDDTYPLGVVVDCSSTKPVQLGDKQTYPPSPALFILSSDATLVPFYMVYHTQDPAPLMTTPVALPAVQAPPTPGQPTQPTQPPVTPQLPRSTPPSSTPITSAQFSFTPQWAVTPPSQVIRNVFAVGDTANIPPSFSLGALKTVTPPTTVTTAPDAGPPASTEQKASLAQHIPNPPANVGEPVTTATTPISTTENSINQVVDSEFTKNILEEMSHFDQELRDLCSKSHGFESIGTKEELANLEDRTSKMCSFNHNMVATMKSQSQEVDDVKSVALDLFSMVEDGHARLERNKDARYRHLVQCQALDLASQERVRRLEDACQYVEGGVRDVLDVLDAQWRQYQETRGDSRLPFGDSTYRSIKTHRNIICRQRVVLHQLRSRLDHARQSHKTPSWRPPIYTQEYPLTNGDRSLSELAESLLETRLEQKNSPELSKRREISPRHESRMRNFFMSRAVTRVKTDDRAPSRLIASVTPRAPLSATTRQPYTPATSITISHPPAALKTSVSSPVGDSTPTLKHPAAQNVTKNLFGATKPDQSQSTPALPTIAPQIPTNEARITNPPLPTMPSSTKSSAGVVTAANSNIATTKSVTTTVAATVAPFGFSAGHKPSTNSFNFGTSKTETRPESPALSSFNFTLDKTKNPLVANAPKTTSFGSSMPGSFSGFGQKSTAFSFSKNAENQPESKPVLQNLLNDVKAEAGTQQPVEDVSTAPVTKADGSLQNTEQSSSSLNSGSTSKGIFTFGSTAFVSSTLSSNVCAGNQGGSLFGGKSLLANKPFSVEKDVSVKSDATVSDSTSATSVDSTASSATTSSSDNLTESSSGVENSAATENPQEKPFSFSTAQQSKDIFGVSTTGLFGKPLGDNQKQSNDTQTYVGFFPPSEIANKPSSTPIPQQDSVSVQKVTPVPSSQIQGTDAKADNNSKTSPTTSVAVVTSAVDGKATDSLEKSAQKPPIFTSNAASNPQQTASIFGQNSSTNTLFGKSVSPPVTTTASSADKPAATTSILGQGFSTTDNSPTPEAVTGTSAMSIFGSNSSSAAATPSATTGNVFGQTKPSIFAQAPASSTSAIFNQTQSTTAQVFGQAATSASQAFSQPTTSTSIFGQQSTASIFGQSSTKPGLVFGQATTTPSLFGQPSNTTSSANVFASQMSTPNTAFAQPATFGQTSPFGQQSKPIFGSTTQSAPTSSIFGSQPSSSTPLFGQSSTSSVSKNLFGSSTTTTSAFGGSGGTLFGKTATTGDATSFSQIHPKASIFGNAASTPAFGQPAFGQQPNAFGQPTTTSQSAGVFASGGSSGGFMGGLGGKPSTENANRNVFGSTNAFATPVNPSPIFGAASSGGFGSFGASGPSNTGAFSSDTSRNIATSGFAVQPTSPTPSGFGGAATFGGSPVFGQKPFGFGQTASFGSSNTGVFGQNVETSATSGFASNTNSPTFGGLAQNAPTFGTVSSSTPAFGGSASFGSGFGSATPPAFGSGSAFTGYRG